MVIRIAAYLRNTCLTFAPSDSGTVDSGVVAETKALTCSSDNNAGMGMTNESLSAGPHSDVILLTIS